MRRKKKRVSRMAEWAKKVATLNQGISPDGLPINPKPPGPSMGMMAHKERGHDGKWHLVWKERFSVEKPGHYSYRRIDPKTGDWKTEWYTLQKGEAP